MYIFYTHTKDASGKVLLTELKLSSYNNRWQIAWINSHEEMLFRLINPLLKAPPIALRSYNEQSKIWTYMEDWGVKTLSNIEAVVKIVGGVIQIQVPDLEAIASRSTFDVSKISQSIRPEDFFYNSTGGTATASGALTKETVREKLALILSVPALTLDAAQNGELKKLYRAAALKYHPDRNGGDGSKMSELNMLWGIYTR